MKLSNENQIPDNPQQFKNLHVLYLAPLKAIVEEKCNEWQKKFAAFGVKCFALTGDTEYDDFNTAQVSSYMNINILLATPEKFDHIIRTDPKSRVLLRILQLVLVDEIHMLADLSRGIYSNANINIVYLL